MIRCTFVVILAILLLIISVSGFFILLISNDCNIFYPYAQSTFQLSQWDSMARPTESVHSPTPFTALNDSFFYTSTLCQLTLILFEVMIALVIIFNNEIGGDIDFTSMVSPSSYNLVPSTSVPSNSPNLSPLKYARKCRLIFALKLIFILLISASFLLRLVTSTWSSILFLNPSRSFAYPSTLSSSPSTSYVTKLIDAVITGASNFSGIIYVTSIIEVLLFVLVLSASTRLSSPLRVTPRTR